MSSGHLMEQFPGLMVRVKQNDTVTFNMKNSAASKNIHSIDIHAVTGPGGGAKATQTPPGGKTGFVWKTLNPASISITAHQRISQHILQTACMDFSLLSQKRGFQR